MEFSGFSGSQRSLSVGVKRTTAARALEGLDTVAGEETVGLGCTLEEDTETYVLEAEVAAETVVERGKVAARDAGLVVVVDVAVAVEVLVHDVAGLNELAGICFTELCDVAVFNLLFAGVETLGDVAHEASTLWPRRSSQG